MSRFLAAADAVLLALRELQASPDAQPYRESYGGWDADYLHGFLRSRYPCSTATVRRALALLVQRGAVTRRPAKINPALSVYVIGPSRAELLPQIRTSVVAALGALNVSDNARAVLPALPGAGLPAMSDAVRQLSDAILMLAAAMEAA